MFWKKSFERFLEGSEKGEQSKYHGHTAPVIDGVSGDPQIAGLWSTKFKELYNRCNPSTRNSLQKQLNYIITEDDLEVLIVDTYTIICAIKRLKAGKSDRKILDVCSCSVCATNFSFQTVLFIYCPVAGGMDIHPNAFVTLLSNLFLEVLRILLCQPTIAALHWPRVSVNYWNSAF